MNRNLTVLIFTGLLILGVAIWLSPRILGLYFQIRGGTILESAVGVEQADKSLACNQAPAEIDPTLVLQAVAYLEKSLKYNPQLSQANYLLGQGYCFLNQWNKARERFKVFIEQRPGNPLGYLELGFIYAAKGNQLLARQTWSKAGVVGNNLIEAGRQLTKNDPTGAIIWLERALWLDPNASETWLALGTVYEQEGLLLKALEVYRQAWSLNPEQAAQPIASLLIKQNSYMQAETTLREALDRFPHSTQRHQWWLTLGSSMEYQGKWVELIQVYSDALAEYPSEVQFLLKLGWAYYNGKGDFSAAQSEFLKAIDVRKDFGDGYAAIGLLLSREKRYDEADFWLRQAVSKSPNNYWFQLYLANNIRDSGDFSTAIQMYQDLETTYPDNPSTWFHLAWAFRKEEDKASALGAIEKYIILLQNPNDYSYARIADFYEWSGDYQKALEAYRQAQKLNPDNKSYADKINQLSALFNFDKSNGQDTP